MALCKTTDDEWTPSGVKSTFNIDLPEDSTTEISSPPTALCGFGWRFSCSIGPESTDTSPKLLDDENRPIPWRRVTVFFDPDLIRGSEYGCVTLHADAKHLILLEDELYTVEFNLPDLNRDATPLGVYMRRSDATSAATITISVAFPTVEMALPGPRDARVEAALASAIRGEEVVDIKFYAYSRVGPDASYVARPRPLFAKLALLQGHSDTLDAYLSGISGAAGFAESKMVDLDVHSPPYERFDEYGYMSDSDFDTDTEEEIDGSLQENIASSNGNVHDSEPQPTEPVPSLLLPSGPLPAPHAPRRMGRAVVVKGYAFQTWYAFLYYLYTKRIVFRSLNSSTTPGTSAIPECSAKSMYKLADAFALEDLKSLAFSSLKSQLSPQNIVREVFSTFTSFYPEIQDIEIEFLLRHIPNLTQDVDETLRSICDGMRPHCVNVLKKIVFERRSES